MSISAAFVRLRVILAALIVVLLVLLVRPAGAVSPNLVLGIVEPKGPNPYPELRQSAPDDRAGVFFIYWMR